MGNGGDVISRLNGLTARVSNDLLFLFRLVAHNGVDRFQFTQQILHPFQRQ